MSRLAHLKTLANQAKIGTAERIVGPTFAPLLARFWGADTGTMTEDTFNQAGRDAIKSAAEDTILQDKDAIRYDQYGAKLVESKYRANEAGVQLPYVEEIGKMLKTLTPEKAAAYSIGSTSASNIFVDDDNNLILKDRIDYPELNKTKGFKRDDSIFMKIHSLFEPDGVFAVSDQNTRDVRLNLGPASESVARKLRDKGQVDNIPQPKPRPRRIGDPPLPRPDYEPAPMISERLLGTL